MIEIKSFAKSDTGKVSHNNEDFFGEFIIGYEHKVFMVADGMGGHNAGEVASMLAVTTFIENYKKSFDETGDTLRAIETAFFEANRKVFEEGTVRKSQQGMGTTLSVLVLKGEKAFIGHVGDSRIYLIRDDECRKLTQDHSLVSKLQENGVITEEEARVHPRRNILYLSLGIKDHIQPQIKGGIDVKNGDVFVICTDGLSNLLSDEEINIIAINNPPKKAVEKMIDLAKERGAPDNVTVEIIRVENRDEEITKARKIKKKKRFGIF
ncbi:MAG: Stp1/IreP family PP2C-type Ser/Thr phosphatase [Candidatus Aminicenantia bacterium]